MPATQSASSPRRQRIRDAFTMIELLVVVSIIAILATLLLPTISLVRDSAKTAICMSQLRQVVMANTAYRTDNDGLYPQFCWNETAGALWSQWVKTPTTQGRWQHFLEEYTETYKVFNCPVSSRLFPKGVVLDQDAGPIKRGAAPGGGSPGWCTTMMAYNSENFGRLGSASTLKGPMTDGKVVNMITTFNNTYGTKASLNRCPVYFDGVWRNGGADHQTVGSFSGSYWPHRKRTANMAFPDAHTETRPYTDVMSWGSSSGGVLQIRP